jgi:hypothetical protein
VFSPNAPIVHVLARRNRKEIEENNADQKEQLASSVEKGMSTPL